LTLLGSEKEIESKEEKALICLHDVLVAQWIERSPPKRQVARSIRAEDVF
jgi:hypothetical protein